MRAQRITETKPVPVGSFQLQVGYQVEVFPLLINAGEWSGQNWGRPRWLKCIEVLCGGAMHCTLSAAAEGFPFQAYLLSVL